LVMKKFGKRACIYQVRVATKLYEGKDVIGGAPTGAGKTLSFFIPLLMALEDKLDKMSIIVTPLNLLGKQNVQTALEDAGLSAIAVSKENANRGTFKAIEEGKYRVVVINPEILMGNQEVENLWTKSRVTKRIMNFIFDEGHCIRQWSKFRKDYALLGNLRHLIPERIPFYVASATLPALVLVEIFETLKLHQTETVHIIYSNDRPEIHLMVRGLVCPANSFADLAFLIPKNHQPGDPPLPSFLVFFDNTKEAEAATKYLWSLLGSSLSSKVVWFHSMMTAEFRDEQVENLQEGKLWGLCCTDSFGMGMDISGIQIVVQWKATCDLCTLWQRFGRAARRDGQTATVILLVEKKDVEEERLKAAERAASKKK
ncbi:P-loop containing nucleoside triphosphate hydrolase protein, partial [Crucibulum laeve]